MRHSKAFEAKRQRLKRKEDAVRSKVDVSGRRTQRIALSALAGGLILLLLYRLFGRRSSKEPSKTPAHNPKSPSLGGWLVRRVLELGFYAMAAELNKKIRR